VRAPFPYRGAAPPVTILQLASVVGGNIHLESFLSDRVFQKYLVATEFYTAGTTLPPHQLVVNTIGDAEVASAALVGAQSLLAQTQAPVINPPTPVMATSRCEIARRLSGVPGVITPKTITLSRELLAAPDAGTTLAHHGFAFPVLVRTPGFHGGDHFVRVDSLDSLPSALLGLPGRELLVIQYLDARSADDGKSRKYRVMMIDGHIYPLHAAISSDWKIHYLRAEMVDFPRHRAEEAEFLLNMPGVLGPRAMTALREI
jgi:hypothetical protein